MYVFKQLLNDVKHLREGHFIFMEELPVLLEDLFCDLLTVSYEDEMFKADSVQTLAFIIRGCFIKQSNLDRGKLDHQFQGQHVWVTGLDGFLMVVVWIRHIIFFEKTKKIK